MADLALGGADLVTTFRQHDLVDEYRLHVHPVLIGRGKPLFQTQTAPRPDFGRGRRRPVGRGGPALSAGCRR